MKVWGLILACTLALLLAGCGGIHSGLVAHKQYHEPYTSTITMCLPIGSNPCGMIQIIPVDEPDCWELDLVNKDDTGSVCVDAQTWARTDIGGHYRGEGAE